MMSQRSADLRTQAIQNAEQHEINELIDKYGTFPPPYFLVKTHPASIAWRMGYGENIIYLWNEWIKTNDWTKTQLIDYFQDFQPPHAWLRWVLTRLNPELGQQLFEHEYKNGAYDKEAGLLFIEPYFSEIEALGFGSFDDWVNDYNDSEKWQD